MSRCGWSRASSLVRSLTVLLAAGGLAAVGVACGGGGGDGDGASGAGDGTGVGTSDGAGAGDLGGGATDGVDPATCDCGAAVCGLDPCGNSCGTCAGDAFCFAGQCQTQASCPMEQALTVLDDGVATLINDKGTERLRFEATAKGGFFTSVEIIANRDADLGGLAAGDYPLQVSELSSCELCVLVHKNCPQQECAFPYVAELGKLSFDEVGFDAGRIAGSASELVFRQAYFDDKTKQVQVLKNGTSFCLEGFDFEASLETVVIEPEDCVPEGSGVLLGSDIADFELQNCEGGVVAFHDNCGATAVWVVAAAGW